VIGDAATDVFERLVESLDASTPAAPRPARATGAERVRLVQLRSAMARAIDLYGDLFQQTFETYAELAQAALQPRPATAGGAPLALEGPPGGLAAVTVWIHNTTADDVRGAAFRLTDLTAHDGATVDAGCGSFLPGSIDVEPGGSRDAILSVAVPASAPVGLYFGHVLAAGLPTAGLAVCLAVT
jgi:hypothetical protein